MCLETAVKFINGPNRCQFRLDDANTVRSDYENAVLKDGRVIFNKKLS